MGTIIVERVINAPLEKVWAVAGDFGKSPGPSISIVVEKEGDPKSYGVGTERIITVKGRRAYERLESVDAPNSFTYKMLSGSPVKSYLGKAEFRAIDNTTAVKWSVEFIPKIPGIGWIISRVTTKVINKFIDELENIK